MAVTSGTSTLSLQTLNVAATAPALLFNIELYDTPLPPSERVGYYFLYMFANASPNQCYVIDRGGIYKPGILGKILIPPLSSAYSFRLDANWNRAGLRWRANIA